MRPIGIHKSLRTFFLASIICTVSSLALSQVNVHEFSGTFTYSIPLMSLPTPYGDPIQVTATYQSDIKVEQDAGDIGLGWSLNIGGAITRTVSGVPDDFKGSGVLSGDTAVKNHCGALKFHDNGGDGDDFFQSTYRMKDKAAEVGSEYHAPDYDHYRVGGMGIDGVIEPHLFDFGEIKSNANIAGYEADGFDMKPQFSYENDYYAKVDCDYWEWDYSPLDANNLPSSITEPSTLTHAYTGEAYNNNVYAHTENRNRLRTARYVEYFTNEEIEDHLDDVTAITGGFVEYGSSEDRGGSNFEATGIGAFRITDENGYQYYYALPVYTKHVISGQYDLKWDYSTLSFDDLKDSTHLSGAYVIQNDTNRRVWQTKSSIRYASAWLLTAIVGPDYEDDGDDKADDDDKGYWVAFEYSKTNNEFEHRYPYAGHNKKFGGVPRSFYDVNETLGVKDTTKITEQYASFLLINEQDYVLSKIKTPSHEIQTVTFDRKDTREVKADYEGYGSTGYTSGSGYDHRKGISELKLVNRSNSEVLQKVKFVQDYKLARGYYRNDNTTLSASDKYDAPADVHSGISFTSNCTDCGKLTLQEIEFYSSENAKTMPDYEFDYGESSSTTNPDYDPSKVDYWGFYKSETDLNGLGGYTTSDADPLVWNLLSITHPLGYEIEVEYEVDRYTKVISDGPDGGYRGAIRTFAIKSADYVSGEIFADWEFDLQHATDDFDEYFDNLATGDKITAMVPAAIIDSSCYCYYNDDITEMNYEWNNGYYYESTTFSNIVTSSTPYRINNLDDDLNSDASTFPTTYTTFPDDLFACQTIGDYTTKGCPDEYGGIFYSGRGFISFLLKEGKEVYGGGTRVKSISKIVGNQTYKHSYEYGKGIAVAEPDAYDIPYINTDETQMTSLNAYRYERFKMPSQVGYARVTSKELGADGSTLGHDIATFMVHPYDDNNSHDYDREYFKPIEIDPTGLTGGYDGYGGIVEYIDKFTSSWGSPMSNETYSKNGSLISATEYSYESPIEGALVEANFYELTVPLTPGDPLEPHWLALSAFNAIDGQTYQQTITTIGLWTSALRNGAGVSNTDPQHFLCMVRKYPNRINGIRSFTNGIWTSVSAEDIDPITGEWKKRKTTDLNDNYSLQKMRFAHDELSNNSMGAKSIDILNSNQLGKVVKEENFPNHNLLSGDFASSVRNTYSNAAQVRVYNTTNTEFENESQTVFPYRNRTYDWQGPLGDYGIYDTTEFADFHTVRKIDGTWLDNEASTYGTLYNNSGWVSLTTGTALTSTNLTTKDFVMVQEDVFDEYFPVEASLSLDPDLILFKASDFADFTDDPSNLEWAEDGEFVLRDSLNYIYLRTLSSIDPNWKQINQTTLLNENGKILESRDEHGRYSATQFDLDGNFVQANVFNSKYAGFTFCPFENTTTLSSQTYAEGEVKITNGALIDTTSNHSGEKCLAFTATGSAKYEIAEYNDIESGQVYIAGAWIKHTGGTAPEIKIYTTGLGAGDLTATANLSDDRAIEVGDWTLVTVELEIPSGLSSPKIYAEVTGASGTYVDDFHFKPLHAGFSAVIIDHERGLKSFDLDQRTMVTEYIYDTQDRLIEVKQDIPDKGRKKLRESEYNYSRAY